MFLSLDGNKNVNRIFIKAFIVRCIISVVQCRELENRDHVCDLNNIYEKLFRRSDPKRTNII